MLRALTAAATIDGQRVEEGDELVLDGLGGGAGDLLRHDATAQAAEGVDVFGEAFGREDAAVVLGDDGLEAWVGFDQVRACFFEEVRGGGRRAGDAGLRGRGVDGLVGVG